MDSVATCPALRHSGVAEGNADWETRKDEGDPKAVYKALLEGGSSGFSALLGGYRGSDGGFSIGDIGFYWSATESSSGSAWGYYFSFSPAYGGKLYRWSYSKSTGMSCRYVQGAPSNGND